MCEKPQYLVLFHLLCVTNIVVMTELLVLTKTRSGEYFSMNTPVSFHMFSSSFFANHWINKI